MLNIIRDNWVKAGHIVNKESLVEKWLNLFCKLRLKVQLKKVSIIFQKVPKINLIYFGFTTTIIQMLFPRNWWINKLNQRIKVAQNPKSPCKILSGKGQNWKVSEMESVRIGKCQNWKVSELERVRIRKCQNWKVSEYTFLQSRKVSESESVRIGKGQNWIGSEPESIWIGRKMSELEKVRIGTGQNPIFAHFGKNWKVSEIGIYQNRKGTLSECVRLGKCSKIVNPFLGKKYFISTICYMWWLSLQNDWSHSRPTFWQLYAALILTDFQILRHHNFERAGLLYYYIYIYHGHFKWNSAYLPSQFFLYDRSAYSDARPILSQF